MLKLRLERDLMYVHNEPLPGILVVADDKDLTLVHALITGTQSTPYEGGFFYFVLKFPRDYPIVPPNVQFMTTGGGTVRMNPNFYKNGKVCLSILGTWTGPVWSPAQTLASVLISIQSLLNDKPYHNEPGFEKERVPGDADCYNAIIQHETLRVAVIGMLDNDYGTYLPDQLKEAMENGFQQNYDFYENLAQSKCHLDGTTMMDPFREERGQFQYSVLLQRLKAIHLRLNTHPRSFQDVCCCDSSPISSPESAD